jgi:hypothetical protein
MSRFPRTGAVSVKVSIAEHPLSFGRFARAALVPSRPPWPKERGCLAGGRG